MLLALEADFGDAVFTSAQAVQHAALASPTLKQTLADALVDSALQLGVLLAGRVVDREIHELVLRRAGADHDHGVRWQITRIVGR